MPLTVNAGSVRRTVFSLLPLVLICMGTPLCAQLTYTGVLDHIEITKHPPYCTGSGTPITEKVPASAGASVSFTVTCGPSSTKLDLSVAFPLTTSKAKATDPHFPEVVEFEEGVRTGFRANATFSHDAASGWSQSYFVPSIDLSPQPGVPDAGGNLRRRGEEGRRGQGAVDQFAQHGLHSGQEAEHGIRSCSEDLLLPPLD